MQLKNGEVKELEESSTSQSEEFVARMKNF